MVSVLHLLTRFMERQKRRSSKDKLRLASAELEQVSSGTPNEVGELVTEILELCKSETIRKCSTCTVIVEQTAFVTARLLPEAKGYFLDEAIQYRLATLDDIVKDVMEDSRNHKSALHISRLRPFKHDHAAVQKMQDRLRLADCLGTHLGPVPNSVHPSNHTSIITIPADSAPTPALSSPPRWTKPLQIICQGLATVTAGIPVVAPFSIIPKAAAAAAGAIDKRHQNDETYDDLRKRVVEIETLGQFSYLQNPIHDFQEASQTIDSRHSLKRVVHATSEAQLLSTVGEKVDRGLLMENLAQTLLEGQRLHDKLSSVIVSTRLNTVFLCTGFVFFPMTEARSSRTSWMSSGVEATFTC